MESNNLVINGSFELGPTPGLSGFVPLLPGSTSIVGWNVIRGGIDYETEWQVGTDGWMSADGNYSLDLNGTPGVGGVAQRFDTTVGQKYLVSFDLAAHPSGLLQTMRVSAAGQAADFSFQSTSNPSDLGWQRITWEFTAVSPQTNLEFYSLQTGYEFGGPALDGVVVTPINHINDTKGKNRLVGTAGTDELNGLNGKDTLIGLVGNDILNGGKGSDTLIGVTPHSSSPGAREIDILTGGTGHDKFVLGDVNKAYYDDGNRDTRGLLDYALITDFSKKDDSIQLNGKANNYLLDEAYLLGGSAGTSIFRKDTVNELIGFVEGVKGLTLNSNDFSFTGLPPDHCKNML